jgi:hypothetical protein
MPVQKHTTRKHRTRPGQQDPTLHLYWVTVPGDESEDWFIFAASSRAAARFHEQYEGYPSGYAEAERIMSVPARMKIADGKPPCHAQIPDLQKLGFEILEGGDSDVRVVRLGERTFVEGVLESLVRTATDNVFELFGEGRPNKTKPVPRAKEQN